MISNDFMSRQTGLGKSSRQVGTDLGKSSRQVRTGNLEIQATGTGLGKSGQVGTG